MRHRILFAVLLSVVSSVTSGQQVVALAPDTPDARAPLFVSVEWLATHQHDPNVVILHVGDPKEYATSHIAGARLASVADVSVGDRAGPGLSVEMPNGDTLRARLSALGISDDSRVVVYFANNQTYQATRILFTLAYAGLGERASLLDGGLGAWTASGHATTDVVPEPRHGELAPLALLSFVVDGAWVQSMLARPGVAIVDARDTAFYGGSRTGGSAAAPHRTGHVPGARNVPYSVLTDSAGRVQPAAAMAEAFAAAGVKPGDVVVGYCHTGQQATAMLMAARSLGYAVLLYDGSFQDWSRRVEFPVETGGARPKP